MWQVALAKQEISHANTDLSIWVFLWQAKWNSGTSQTVITASFSSVCSLHFLKCLTPNVLKSVWEIWEQPFFLVNDSCTKIKTNTKIATNSCMPLRNCDVLPTTKRTKECMLQFCKHPWRPTLCNILPFDVLVFQLSNDLTRSERIPCKADSHWKLALHCILDLATQTSLITRQAVGLQLYQFFRVRVAGLYCMARRRKDQKSSLTDQAQTMTKELFDWPCSDGVCMLYSTNRFFFIWAVRPSVAVVTTEGPVQGINWLAKFRRLGDKVGD